jgi:hypothetical protein
VYPESKQDTLPFSDAHSFLVHVLLTPCFVDHHSDKESLSHKNSHTKCVS